MIRRMSHSTLLIGGVLFILCAAVWSVVYADSSQQGTGHLTFAMLDIGQGDGLFIEGPTGVQVMVDSGPGDGSALQQLPKVMPVGDRSLDAIIETHPDADHMGEFSDIIKHYDVGLFISPDIVKHDATTDALDAAVAQAHIPRLVARRGMTLDLGGGAHLDILYPDLDVTNFGNKTNEGSIVAHLVYGSTSVMLTADAPFSTEEHLLAIASTTELQSDLLKVGHHGSKYSTSAAFVAGVHPQLALISVGAHNKYGHPAPRVLDTLTQAGVPILRTDQKGTITCISDGAKFSCSSEK